MFDFFFLGGGEGRGVLVAVVDTRIYFIKLKMVN